MRLWGYFEPQGKVNTSKQIFRGFGVHSHLGADEALLGVLGFRSYMFQGLVG